MKNLTVTVNGVAYNVTVEENTNGAAPAAAPAAAVFRFPLNLANRIENEVSQISFGVSLLTFAKT